jgi:hypothetical protein
MRSFHSTLSVCGSHIHKPMPVALTAMRSFSSLSRRASPRVTCSVTSYATTQMVVLPLGSRIGSMRVS